MEVFSDSKPKLVVIFVRLKVKISITLQKRREKRKKKLKIKKKQDILCNPVFDKNNFLHCILTKKQISVDILNVYTSMTAYTIII